MRYKKYGEVSEIPSDTRGLKSNAEILAFPFMQTLCGIGSGNVSQTDEKIVSAKYNKG